MSALAGLTVLAAYLRARHGPGARARTRAALEAYQARAVERHLRRVLPRSPFYRRRFAGQAWAAVPPITKRDMLAHFDELNTAGARYAEAVALAERAEQSRDFSPTLRGLTVGLSSGTSGARGLFLVSPAERAAWAGAALARVLPSGRLTAQRVAFFLRANSNLYTSVRSRLIRFAYFDLLDPLPAHVARLNAFRPSLLVGPPALLALLAHEARASRLTIAPRKVVAVAEVLDPLDAAAIAAQFGGPLHQVYQATEGFLGATCESGTLHLNEDLLVVQPDWLDEGAGKFAPILTDFHRLTQPILRYRLDDILTVRATPCPCGSPRRALAAVEGRCDDIFYFPAASGSGWALVFPDFIRQAVCAGGGPDLEGYTATQTGPGRMEIALAVPAAARAEAEADISAALAALCTRVGAVAPQVAYRAGGAPVLGPRKFKRVTRQMPAPQGA
ncbi:MAG: adenylate cyclase [Anaerolineales bacterium]|nr:adenylate cyclase [Anaerolineales bacterium]